MQTPAKARGTTQQINIRWESGDVETIRRIAEKEERSSSEIVRWFVRWGAKHFDHAGSLAALEMTSLDYAQKLIDALSNAQREIERQIYEVQHEVQHISMQELLTSRTQTKRKVVRAKQ